MKFFISGQIDDTPNIQSLMQAVKAKGHVITHDWTGSDAMLGGAEAKMKNIEETAHRAKDDIQGVIAADIYVLSSDNKKVGKGMYVELGAALALYETMGKPRVYVIGALQHLSVFYLHPSVSRRDTIDEVLKEV